MAKLQGWIYQIIYLVVFLNMTVSLVQKKTYARYLRVVCGWLLTLYILIPVVGWLGNGNESLPEFSVTGGMMEENREGLLEHMLSFYEQGMEKQVIRYVKDEGYEPVAVRVELTGNGETMEIARITIVVGAGKDAEELKKSLAVFYHLREEVISVSVAESRG